MNRESLPTIIQGGMGVGVSGWRLARAVSRTGQLGVVSGTALDVVMARRLQLGDRGGHTRRALESFPFSDVAERIVNRYFVPGGKGEDEPYRATPMPSVPLDPFHEQLLAAANFVEIFLAREGHENPVGINYLEKIQFPTLPSLYGAMLAGVGFVLMGAGIPRAIPGALDRFADGEPAQLRLDVRDAPRSEEFLSQFDPLSLSGGQRVRLPRPRFLAIVSSATLASMLLKRSNGTIDGFVIEGFTAGGHNAPPRGVLQVAEDGQPIYGRRDVPNLEAIAALDMPFWLAGSFGTPESLVDALRAGACGVQVGTAFAFCDESDLDADMKGRIVRTSRTEDLRVFTDPVASPTGFPFKVLPVDGTLSDPQTYAQRRRVCDLAYLRHAYKKPDGQLGWRCPAGPVNEYVRLGGSLDETAGRKCLCNALLADIGLGQVRGDGNRELPLVTSGQDVANIALFLKASSASYSAHDVIEALLAGTEIPLPSRPAAEVL